MSHSDAAAWRRQADAMRAARAVPLELPSGATVLAVRPDLNQWLMHGRLPSEVTRILATAEQGETPEMTADNIIAMGAFVADIVAAAVVAPKVVRGTPGPGEIAIAEIPAEDADFIYSWALRKEEAAALRRFRGGRGDAAAGAHGPHVRAKAKRDGADRGPGAGDGL